MTFRFDSNDGLIIVRTQLVGPSSTAIIRLALDTGATRTLVNTRILTTIGYDPGLAEERVEVTTGSRIEYSPLVPVDHITCLGIQRTDMLVLSHTLPPSAGIDGLLGLDFFRSFKLTIDFQNGSIELLS